MTSLEIEAFLTVVNCGSLSAAAQQLYITQPALTRRLQALEEDLGYMLLKRRKGLRAAELTNEGRTFIPLARKYNLLWREAKALPECKKILRLSAIGSLSTYLLPNVFESFMTTWTDYQLQVYHYSSLEAYSHIAHGDVDISLISDDMFSKEIQTIPLFREKMLLALSPGEKYTAPQQPSDLNALDEIRLPWNPEYDLWHDFWFPQLQPPRVFLDQMSLLEYFIRQRDLWAFVPASAKEQLEAIPNVRVCEIQQEPPERFIYYLTKTHELSQAAKGFLDLMLEKLATISGITVLS